MYHGWIDIVRPGGRGRETVIDYQSLKNAYDRFKRGEQPHAYAFRGWNGGRRLKKMSASRLDTAAM